MRARGFAGAGAALLLLSALAGCTWSTPSPTPSSSTGRPDSPRDPAVPADIEAVISVAGVDVDGRNVTVSGFVQGIIENGGDCVFSFVGPAGATVGATTEGAADRSVTVCGGTQTPRERFTKGTWKVTLTYTAVSGKRYESDPSEILIP